MSDTDDPVLESRARIATLVKWGLRGGYGLFALSMVLFFVALGVGFTSLLAGAITFCLVVGSVILAPAIVFNYAVKAAHRADRDGTW
ncbi:MAG: hypothetical protein AAF962_00105 [Actinomycetota bacterium]